MNKPCKNCGKTTWCAILASVETVEYGIIRSFQCGECKHLFSHNTSRTFDTDA